MQKSLYEIEQVYIDWLAKVEENDGEVTDELMIELESLTSDFDTKAETLGVFIKDLRADSEKYKAEKLKLEARQSSATKLADRLVERLQSSMRTTGRTKFSSPKVQISFRNSASVKIVDETLIPEEFWKVTKEPKKQDIKDAIKAGIEIPGAEIEQNENLWVR